MFFTFDWSVPFKKNLVNDLIFELEAFEYLYQVLYVLLLFDDSSSYHSTSLSIRGIQQFIQTFSGIFQELVSHTFFSVEESHTQMNAGKQISNL